MPTIMIDDLILARLMAWLSPVFPTGSFAYSSGLEAAVSNDLVTDQVALGEWLTSLLKHGRLRNDAIFLGEALRNWENPGSLSEVNDLAFSSAGSEELCLESTAQGRAFIDALKGWELSSAIDLPKPCTLPVAVGAACGAAGIAQRQTILAYAHTFVANQLQIAIRLSVIGQIGAAKLLANLEMLVINFAANTETATLDDLGSATIMADIMAMRHETQHGRLFRS